MFQRKGNFDRIAGRKNNSKLIDLQRPTDGKERVVSARNQTMPSCKERTEMKKFHQKSCS